MARILSLLTTIGTFAALASAQCPISLNFSPMLIEARLGERVVISCDVLGDRFLHRDFRQFLPNGDTIDVLDNSGLTMQRNFMRNFTTLTITSVESYHAGQYGCFSSVAMTGCPQVVFSPNITLTIVGPPEITIISSSSTSGLAATDFSLELLITGTSPVTVQVFKDNVDVVDSGRVELSSMGTQHDLSIKDLRQADAGEYTILASNSIGKNSTTVTLNVEGPDPPIVRLMDVGVSTYSSSYTVECSLANSELGSPVTFHWTNPQGEIIVQSNKFMLSSTSTYSRLTINSFSRNSTGYYICTARNERGNNSRQVRLFGPPRMVTQIRVLAGNGRQRTVTWEQINDLSEPIVHHTVVLYRMDSDEVVYTVDVDIDTNSSGMYSHIIPNLDPGDYQLTITPVSRDGEDTLVQGTESLRQRLSVDAEETNILAIAIGAGAGGALLLALAAAIAIFCLCFYYPHRRKLQSQQQTWSREDMIKPDSPAQNEYTALTLRPNSDYPPSPGMNSPSASQFLADIDPKWEFPRENIKLCDPLCEGQFTVLYKAVATNIQDKMVEVAVKSVRVDATEDDVKALVAEMEMMSSIGPHENIVSMLRVCTVGKPMYMVMEYMCHGDLLGFLRASRGHGGRYTVSPGLGYQPPAINLYPRDLLNIGAKIANGMGYLADRKLVHRALCSKNVLVGSNMSVKIYNIGSFDNVFESRDYIMKWLAPETLFDQTATTYSDVWSFGVTLWELVTVGGIPYGEIQPEDLYSQLIEGMRMPCPQHCAQEIHELMLDCWSRNPVDRPHFSVIHERLEDLATSKMNLLDFQNYDMYTYSQFEEPMSLSTVL